ncbi:MAG: uracil-DNA glycosylase [Planctomycetota bacterium]|nr:uracil-DNA glycosylase [Planctomycetota bacterium]
MKKNMGPSWNARVGDEFQQDYFQELEAFVDQARQGTTVFPGEEDVFRAFQLTPLDQVKVVILGQDPYHDHGQAHGLSFSVLEGNRHPPSLRNIFKELANDLGFTPPRSGNLGQWAQQGVLLLNTVLTVEAHRPHSHQKRGWEVFTDKIISVIGGRNQHTVFVLWGRPAQTKEKLIDGTVHTVIKSPHPSPLSASRGFFGSKPFSRSNQALKENGQKPVNWRL